MPLLSAVGHKMRLAGILVPVVLFTAAAAPAAMINGNFNVVDIGGGPGFGGPSLGALTSINFADPSVTTWVTATTGDFAVGGAAPIKEYTATSVSDLTGIVLDGTVHADVIPGWIQLINSNSPSDLYQFNLATLKATLDTLPSSGAITGVTLFGTGTISDPADAFDPTPAQITMTVNSADGSTLSNFGGSFAAIAAVPEPASMTMLAVAGLALLRRRRA